MYLLFLDNNMSFKTQNKNKPCLNAFANDFSLPKNMLNIDDLRTGVSWSKMAAWSNPAKQLVLWRKLNTLKTYLPLEALNCK